MHNEIIVKKGGHRELDLIAAAKVLLRKIWLVAFVSLLCGALFFAYTYLMVEPEYVSSMELSVSNKSDAGAGSTSVTTSDISASMMLMYTYAHVLKTPETISEIVELSQTGRSVDEMMRMISVIGNENINILTVTATSNDPNETVQILNAVAEIAPELPKSIESSSSVKVLSRAKLPRGRSSPNYAKAGMVGVIIGGFLSCVLILLVAITDTKIRNEKEALSLGYPLLGTVPFSEDRAKGRRRISRQNAGYMLDDKITPGVLKQWEQIEKNLMFSLPGSGCKKILFSSITYNVRKCTAAVNLCRRTAKLGYSVLLVDCNLLKSEIADLFGYENEPGLTNVLTGHSKTEAVLRHYNEKMDVLTAGSSSPNPAELLGSEEMRQLLRETEKDHGYVFLNTTPVREKDLNADLYRQMSGVVVVIRAGVTKRDELRDHVDRILAEGGTILGLILSTDKRK